MKRTLQTGLLVLTFGMATTHVDAASILTTTLSENPGNLNSQTMVWTVNADGTESSVASGNAGVPTSGDLSDGATGSFTMTWAAVDNFNETTFANTAGFGWAWNGSIFNFGPKSTSTDTIIIATGEAILISFDLSGLTLSPGYSLVLNGFNTQNQNGATDAGLRISHLASGELTATEIVNDSIPAVIGDNVFQEVSQDVGTGDQVALWRQSGFSGQTRIYSFQFAVVPEPSSLALIGLGGLLVARRRRA